MTSPRRLWLAVTAAFMLNGAFYGIWAARIPAVANEFSLQHDQLGLLLLLLALGAILCFPIAGRLADHHGAARVTRIMSLVNAASMIGLAFSPNVWAIGASLFLFGASHGGMDVAMNAWASDLERRQKRTWMPSFHAMWSFGAGLGAISGFFAISADQSYTLHFAISAAIVPLLGLWGMRIPWTENRISSGSGTAIFPIPRGMLLLVGGFAFCTTMGEGAMVDWSAIYMIEEIMAEEQVAPIGFAIFSATMVIMRLMGGMVISFLGQTRAGIMSAIVAVAGTGTVVLASNVPIVILGFILMGAGYALAMPIAFSRAGSDPDIPPAQAIASVATLGYGGILLGPPIIGFLAEIISLRGAFGILFLLAIAMLVLAPAIKPQTPKTVDAA